MKKIEIYSNLATHAIVNVPNLSQEEFDDRLDEILSLLSLEDIPIEELTDTSLDQENNIVNMYFLVPGEEVLVHSFEEKESTPDMRVDEYIVFNKELTEKFNYADSNGKKDFKIGDEIKIGGISHLYGEPREIRYRLDTYVVQSEHIEITLEEVKEETKEESSNE